MQDMVSVLKRLADCCHGDDRPNCPILNDLSGGKVAGRPARAQNAAAAEIRLTFPSGEGA